MAHTVFIYHRGRTFPLLAPWMARHPQNLAARILSRLDRFLERRRNPRDRAYMEQLARSRSTQANSQVIAVGDDLRTISALDWPNIGEVVLLWPDANGTGWFRLEQLVMRHKSALTTVRGLNGRRRSFELNPTTWASFKWRRVIEKSLAVEGVCLIILIGITPWLMAWDFLRGRS